jgi:2-methylisocitrate lyase-like PEP mutase family enzyme
MPSQAQKATAFRALHERAGAFLLPNPWDIGTARLLAQTRPRSRDREAA